MMKQVKMEIRNLTKKYSAHEGIENINLDIYDGELLTLLGPSGCGKTTILRCIGGFNSVDSGEILLDGKPIHNLPPEKRPTAMVFQSYNLWPHMTIYENMSLGLKLRKVRTCEMKEQVNNMLKIMRMEGSEKKYPAQLSGGQQQRIAIGRSLLLKPSILLLDEPFSALDAKIRGQMREELRRIQTEFEMTILFVTHDQEEAMTLSDRIAVMKNCTFEQLDTPAAIYDHPNNEFIAGFIGQMNFIPTPEGKMAVRPENVFMQHTAGPGDVEGTIQSVMILGHYVEINAVLPDTTPVKCYMPREIAQGYLPQQKVYMRFENPLMFSA